MVIKWLSFILVLLVGCYGLFIILAYSRIGDVWLEADNKKDSILVKNDRVYTVSSYNIGFGAYQQDYTCVMDSCYVQDGDGWKKVRGKNLKAFSKADAVANTWGAGKTIGSLNPDFVLFQEIDEKSDRCYGFNQVAMMKEYLGKNAGVFCLNFHMPFLAYPLNDMMGSVKSGLLTLSCCSIVGARRCELAVSAHIIKRLFDLDRCFLVTYFEVENGRRLVLVNIHMSAYDEGGIIRGRQREQLFSFIEEEYRLGNYVIVGGDFNHDLLTNNPAYPKYGRDNVAFSHNMWQKCPDDNVFFFDDNQEAGLPMGFKVVAADNAPSCRPAAISWQPGFSYVRTLDGFIVSANVKVESIENIVTSSQRLQGFAFSDHDPVFMRFVLY